MKSIKKIPGIVILSLIFVSLWMPNLFNVSARPKQPWNIVDAFWGTQTNPMEAGPGDQHVPLSIIIQYVPEEQVTATGISMELIPNGPFSNPLVGNTTPVAYPTVFGGLTATETEFNPGDTGIVQFIVNIHSNVQATNIYKMYLRIMYFEKPLTGELNYEQVTMSFTVQVLGRPQLEVNLPNTILLTEQTTDITIEIGNTGSAVANDVQVEMTIPPPLIVIEGTTSWELGQLAVDTTQKIRVPLYAPKISLTSTYQLVILVFYRDQTGITRSETHYGGVVVHGNTDRTTNHLEVEFSVGNITAGKSNSLLIQVMNPNSNAVFDARVGLELPPPLILMGMDNQWQFEQIPTQSGQEIPVEIYAPEAGMGYTYPIVVTIAFKDHMGVDQIETRTLGLLVIGDIDLLVYELVTFPLQVPVGGNFTVSGSILNRGNVEAMYTNVTIVEDTNFFTTASSTYYVGQIDPNAPIPFALTGYLQPEIGEGTYPLSIVVAYRDNFGGRYTLTTTLPVIVVPAGQVMATTSAPSVTQRFTSTFFRPLPLLITAIVIIILWRILRKSEEED